MRVDDTETVGEGASLRRLFILNVNGSYIMQDYMDKNPRKLWTKGKNQRTRSQQYSDRNDKWH